MTNKFLLTSAVASLIGLMTINTQAASIWLEPASQNINVGGVANLELWADASDVGGFLAGELDVFVEEFPKDPTKIPVLSYNDDFIFDAAFPTDPVFSSTGDNCFVDPSITGCSGANEINGIAFGSFTGLAAAGPTLVGTLSFTGVNLGYAVVYMMDNDIPTGGWFATDGSSLTVNYSSARINVVPVPATVWLMTSGLAMLLGFARKHKTA